MRDITIEDVRPTRAVGSRHPAAKLNEDQVTSIRALHKDGGSIIGIARAFGVSPPTIRAILRRQTWAHV